MTAHVTGAAEPAMWPAYNAGLAGCRLAPCDPGNTHPPLPRQPENPPTWGRGNAHNGAIRQRECLRETLWFAVPFHAAERALRPLSMVLADGRRLWVRAVADGAGAALLYVNTKPGQAGAEFNRLARGIAALAFADGGITCFDLHFHYRHPDAGACRSDRAAR